MAWRRRLVFYVSIAVCWTAVCVWQYVEHGRVATAAGDALLAQAADITASLGIALRSQARALGFRPAIVQAALDDLVTSSEILSIVLLGQEGKIVAAAGDPLGVDAADLAAGDILFDRDRITVVAGVDLEPRGGPPPPKPPDPERARRQGPFARWLRLRRFWTQPWVEDLAARHKVSRFVISLSSEAKDAQVERDLWLRLSVCGATLAAGLGIAFAWRGLVRSTELRLRLLRSEQEKGFLEEKSLAAAGLAHETRNPLNVIGGLAQVLARDPAVPAEVRTRATRLIDEVDRVAGHLQKFVDYAKPVEPNAAATDLEPVIRSVLDTLETDREDKAIRCSVDGPAIAVAADASLLRQALFNILLNAYQAVGRDGRVAVRFGPDRDGRVSIEVADDGPGVPEEDRERIFRPYVTGREGGTGLGLAVVRQIAEAHGWKVTCAAAPEGGALFRLSGIAAA